MEISLFKLKNKMEKGENLDRNNKNTKMNSNINIRNCSKEKFIQNKLLFDKTRK